MKQTTIFNPVLIADCVIVMLSFAIKASFGVFQLPVANEFGWLLPFKIFFRLLDNRSLVRSKKN